MNIYKLVNSNIKEINFEDIDRKGTIWIRAIAPTEEDLKKLISISNIPIEELRESMEEEERPRLFKKRYIELIYDAPFYTKEDGLTTKEIYFYISRNLVITIEEETNKVLTKIENKCKANRSKFIFRSQGQFLFHVLDEINDEFLNRIERIGRNLHALRTTHVTKEDLRSLYDANLTSAYFNQALIANLEVLNQLKKCHHKSFKQNDRLAFNELYIDKLQIIDTEKIQRDLIMNVIDLQTIRSTDRLNTTVKRLTAFALLIMVPTFVTGLYGMNVEVPFAHHQHAFAIISAVMILGLFLLLYLFRKWDWI